MPLDLTYLKAMQVRTLGLDLFGRDGLSGANVSKGIDPMYSGDDQVKQQKSHVTKGTN